MKIYYLIFTLLFLIYSCGSQPSRAPSSEEGEWVEMGEQTETSMDTASMSPVESGVDDPPMISVRPVAVPPRSNDSVGGR